MASDISRSFAQRLACLNEARPPAPDRGKRKAPPRAGRSLRRGGVGFPGEPSPRNQRYMMRHDQDSFVAKNFLGPLSQQYLSLTGTIAQLYLVRMLQRKNPACEAATREREEDWS